MNQSHSYQNPLEEEMGNFLKRTECGTPVARKALPRKGLIDVGGGSPKELELSKRKKGLGRSLRGGGARNGGTFRAGLLRELGGVLLSQPQRKYKKQKGSTTLMVWRD